MDYFFFFSVGNLQIGIEQLRSCDRCHRTFSVLSDLFNHMCDDEDATKPDKSTYSTPKEPSDHLTKQKTNLDTDFLVNQGSGSSSFKLNRRSSFNDSMTSANYSRKLFSTPSSARNGPVYQSSIHMTPVTPLIDRRLSSEQSNISTKPRSALFRRDSLNLTSETSLSSPRSLINDSHAKTQQEYTPRSFVFVRRPSTVMEVRS